MAPERHPDAVPDANEADVEEQHQPVDEDGDDAVTATPVVERVPVEAPEADVLEQRQTEPYDDEDAYD
jgi:hypothetical protein